MFQDVLNSIIPVPKSTVKPISAWSVRNDAGARSSYSRKYWDAVADTPTGGWGRDYEFTECKEHKRTEAIPNESYHDGLLHYWYEAGLHPRWNIWGAIIAQTPKFPRSWLWRIDDRRNGGKAMNQLLRKYKDDPVGFGKEIATTYYKLKNVRMMAGGRSWSVPRQFRDEYQAKKFKVEDFLAEGNQTFRRLMLLSRSFTIEEVVKHMTLVAKDEEGEILLDRPTAWGVGQHYLHVVCPTTGEHYLLGIPLRRACKHGLPISRANADNRWRSPTAEDGCWETDSTKTAWTPAAARRWTFGLEPDAEFLAEA